MKKLLSITIISLIFIGCTDTEKAKFSAYGSKHKVEFFSGGKLVREYISTGKVHSENNSDGWSFKDSKTEKLVRLTGDVIVTAIE